MTQRSAEGGRRVKAVVGLVAALAVLFLVSVFWSSRQSEAAPSETAGARDVDGVTSRAGGDDLAANASGGPRSSLTATSSGASQVKAAPARRDSGVFAKFGWGSGSENLGRDRPEEANPEGPMSFAVDAQGRAVVLDQVNGRLLRLGEDGAVKDEVPLTVRAAQDVAVAQDGTLAVLDRLADRTVAIHDETGKLLGELPVAGRGIDEPGGVTGLFIDGEDVYLEREHGALVKVGDTQGRPDSERPEIPGRPSRNGKFFLNAGLIDAAGGRLYVNAISRPEQDHLYTRELQLGVPLLAILALDTDLQGVVYVGLLVELPGATADEASRFNVRLVCLRGEDGAPLGQAELPATTLPEESFRDFAIQNEGGVLYAYRTEAGVEYRRADCR